MGATGASEVGSSHQTQRAGRGTRTGNAAESTLSQNAGQSATQVGPSGLDNFPRSLVASLRPIATGYAPHTDALKKSLQYLAEAGIEYEEFHGSSTSKEVGSTESVDDQSHQKGKKAGRTKASQASASRQSFSVDPHIHDLEDAVLVVQEQQLKTDAERQALEKLQAMISLGSVPPGKDLPTSFDLMVKQEIKSIQARRKHQLKTQPTPGGIDPAVFEFRTKVWEVHHPKEPLPTTSGTMVDGAGDEDEDDEMEVVDVAQVVSLKCPITTNYLEDPVTSSLCKHNFSKQAIIAMISSRGRNQCICPVHGREFCSFNHQARTLD
ncbi:hypothetical protein BGW38_010535 [Lunasporangiospora selenospora]|uniref:SP-RING-type domain-containing protein n=1 Tax=Lunasporangiospora selenospora TaxID=979761 RepID=A0A9P6KII3_9FUNG|nr:hypothetical protein BGW38_010535 [Lunasporangiospora selenospora]